MTIANYRNPQAECLHINMDVSGILWGAPLGGPALDPTYGRILVVREDQVSITVHQVEASPLHLPHVYMLMF